MKPAPFRRALRTGFGLLRLAEFALAALLYRVFAHCLGAANPHRRRALWLAMLCRRTVRILHCRVVVHGRPPRTGLLVANHLGYADVLALGALTPCAFVAKQDVSGWPFIGWLVALAGTIFVDRERRCRLARSLPAIEATLAAGVPVAVFPEGTSTDGSRVLPFRSALLAVAERCGCPVTPVGIRYENADGSPNRKLAYHGADSFVPHLLSALGAERTTVHILFGEPVRGTCRKELARRLHADVAALLTIRGDGNGRRRAWPSISDGIPRP